MVLPLGLCLLWALAASQEICSSPGDLPAPTLILDKGSSHAADNVLLLCFIPMDTSVTHVIFCKDGKEILMLPKDGNKFIFESAQPVSAESAGEYSCRYQHKDDGNQQKTSLPSTRRYLSVPGGPSPSENNTSGAEPSPPGSLVTSQEICSSPGTLPAPRLFLDRLSARQGDTAMLSCLVPLDAPMTRIVFCKDGKEISVQPKEENKLVYDSSYPVSRESAGAFSCRYQLMNDSDQENNSLPSDSWHLHVADGDNSGEGTLFQGAWGGAQQWQGSCGLWICDAASSTNIWPGSQWLPGCDPALCQSAADHGVSAALWKGLHGTGLDITLWVWILRSTLVLLLLVSAPIITCILRKRAIAHPIQKAVGGNGREEE